MSFWQKLFGAKFKKAKADAITREQQESLWLRSMELWAVGHDRTKVKVVTIGESGAKTLHTSPEVAKWAAPILEMVGKADKLAKQGKYIEAINAYKQVLNEAPNAAIALMSIGVCYCHMGDKANGLKWMRQAKSADPDNERVIKNLRIAERM
jgi:tetratricopeptide (TPR) repeat protein